MSIAIEKLPREFLPEFTASSTQESPTTRENETVAVMPSNPLLLDPVKVEAFQEVVAGRLLEARTSLFGYWGAMP